MKPSPHEDARTDQFSNPPSDWQLVRGWIVRVYGRHRTPLLLAANIIVTLVAILVYNALTPAPQRLTQRDIDAAVDRSLENAPTKPSSASLAYDIIRPSVVTVQAMGQGTTEGHSALGAGVVITDTGIILTCLHVVQDSSSVRVIFADGFDSEAFVISREPENDLAVLSAVRTPDDLVPATMAGPSSLRVGDEVIAVGNPFGIMNSVSAGVVSGLGREYTFPETGFTLQNLIQFDAAVNPGNSGGPLVNRDGEVVGLVASLLNPTRQDVFIGIGFAITMETAGAAIGSPPI